LPGHDGVFEREIAPHIPAAYNLARWLSGNGADADDALQEASLRAYRFIDRVRAGEGKAWLFQIVRNCCFTAIRSRRGHRDLEDIPEPADPQPSPESQLEIEATAQELRSALERLPAEFREVLILREWEELSYREIADITAVPEGTVMSRLARARARLRKELEEGGH
jgi:RNA polymerase sigma-70 factor (ECF subfamily)